MDLSKALNIYSNPELENYLLIKEIFKDKGFLLPTSFDFSNRFSKDTAPLFYFFNFYTENPTKYGRVGDNTIPVFTDDSLEIVSYPSNNQHVISLDSMKNLRFANNNSGILSFTSEKEVMRFVSKSFDEKDSTFSIRLKKEGVFRKNFENILDSNELNIHLQREIWESGNLFKNNKEKIQDILKSKTATFNNFNINNLLYLKILYYDSINRTINRYNVENHDLFIKELIGDAVKRGKKMERVFKYTQNLLKKEKLLTKMKDFTFFKFI